MGFAAHSKVDANDGFMYANTNAELVSFITLLSL